MVFDNSTIASILSFIGFGQIDALPAITSKKQSNSNNNNSILSDNATKKKSKPHQNRWARIVVLSRVSKAWSTEVINLLSQNISEFVLCDERQKYSTSPYENSDAIIHNLSHTSKFLTWLQKQEFFISQIVHFTAIECSKKQTSFVNITKLPLGTSIQKDSLSKQVSKIAKKRKKQAKFCETFFALLQKMTSLQFLNLNKFIMENNFSATVGVTESVDSLESFPTINWIEKLENLNTIVLCRSVLNQNLETCTNLKQLIYGTDFSAFPVTEGLASKLERIECDSSKVTLDDMKALQTSTTLKHMKFICDNSDMILLPSSLEKLELIVKNKQNVLPTVIEQARQAKNISVHYSPQKHEMPVVLEDNFSSLDKLEVLGIQFYGYSLVGEAFCVSQTLTSLDLSHNNINFFAAKALEGLKHIKILNLAFNSIETLPDEFNYLQSLEELNLRGNLLFDLPQVVVLENLKQLDLSQNNFSTIPTSVLSMKSLQRFKFDEMEVKTIPSEFWTTMTQLQYFSCRGIKLKGLPAEIAGLENLHTLDVSYNLLTSIPKEILQCKALKKFKAAFNPISTLPICLVIPSKAKIEETTTQFLQQLQQFYDQQYSTETSAIAKVIQMKKTSKKAKNKTKKKQNNTPTSPKSQKIKQVLEQSPYSNKVIFPMPFSSDNSKSKKDKNNTSIVESKIVDKIEEVKSDQYAKYQKVFPFQDAALIAALRELVERYYWKEHMKKWQRKKRDSTCQQEAIGGPMIRKIKSVQLQNVKLVSTEKVTLLCKYTTTGKIVEENKKCKQVVILPVTINVQNTTVDSIGKPDIIYSKFITRV